MYYRWHNCNVSPFEIECTNCRSHDVDVRALKRNQFEIRCNKCDSYLNSNSYNELTFREYNEGRSTGCALLVMAMVVIVVVAIIVMV